MIDSRNINVTFGSQATFSQKIIKKIKYRNWETKDKKKKSEEQSKRSNIWIMGVLERVQRN